jgi:hypothetical protein
MNLLKIFFRNQGLPLGIPAIGKEDAPLIIKYLVTLFYIDQLKLLDLGLGRTLWSWIWENTN